MSHHRNTTTQVRHKSKRRTSSTWLTRAAAVTTVLCCWTLPQPTLAFCPGVSRSFSTTKTTTTTTILFPHRFGAGYDASRTVTWTPQQAAEFVLFHTGAPSEAGTQLAPLIQEWSGTEMGEFLTRLYLGEIGSRKEEDDSQDPKTKKRNRKVSYDPKHVRTPQWKGLERTSEDIITQSSDDSGDSSISANKTSDKDEEGKSQQKDKNKDDKAVASSSPPPEPVTGLLALWDLLLAAMPDQVLTPPELARCAEAFLLREHMWPRHEEKKEVAPKNQKVDDSGNDNDNDDKNGSSKLKIKAKTSKSSKKSQGPLELETDTFAGQGHAGSIARVLGGIRHQRFFPQTTTNSTKKSSTQPNSPPTILFTVSELIDMVTLPEHDEKDIHPLLLMEFYKHVGIQLSASDKVTMVQGMAIEGWDPSGIAQFLGAIPVTLGDDESADIDRVHPKGTTSGMSSNMYLTSGMSSSLEASSRKKKEKRDPAAEPANFHESYDKLVKSYWNQVAKESASVKKASHKDVNGASSSSEPGWLFGKK